MLGREGNVRERRGAAFELPPGLHEANKKKKNKELGAQSMTYTYILLTLIRTNGRVLFLLDPIQ